MTEERTIEDVEFVAEEARRQMADLNSQTVHSGNTVSILLNGIEVGRAQSLSAQREFGTEGVYEIGSLVPQEHDCWHPMEEEEE